MVVMAIQLESAADVPAQIFNPLDRIPFAEIVVLVVGAWALIRVVSHGLPWLAERLPPRFRPYILPSVPILRLIILAVAFLELVPRVIQPTPQNMIAILGALALSLGFAFQDHIASLVAGIVALYERPYRPGDWVTIDGTYGEVRSLGLRALRIVTLDDTVVTVPHSRMLKTSVHNANDGNREHMCVADFYVDPEHDGAGVRRALLDVGYTSPYLHLDRTVTVTAAEKPWATHYRLKAYPIDGRDQTQFVTDLTLRGKEVLARLGVRPAMVPAATISPT